MSARLDGIDLRVTDIDQTYRFYRELVGLEIDAPARDHGLDERHIHAVWPVGGNGERYMLTLRDRGTGAKTHVRLSFAVDELDEAHRRLASRGAVVRFAPKDGPYGRTAQYKDPDGNILTLFEGRRG